MTESKVYCLLLPLRFPAGLAPGEESFDNILRLSRDGKGVPVLRGSAIAGVLRHAWRKRFGYGTDDNNWFGFTDEKNTTSSRLQVPDCPFEGTADLVTSRTHNLIDRFSGAPVDGGLFSLEVCPPGTSADLALWLDCSREPDRISGDPELFLRQLVACVRDGLYFGGKNARGIGLAELRDDAMVKTYDLDDIDQHVTFLDDRRGVSLGDRVTDGMRAIDANAIEPGNSLVVEVDLGVARGQDCLVADGQGLDFQLEPQRAVNADGKDCWRLPGSSLRGLFRAWMTRLAAREGEPVANSAVLEMKRRNNVATGDEEMNGDNLGWGFIPKDARRTESTDAADEACPIMRLFGSLRKAGRIHFADAFVESGGEADPARQMRVHVAVDRVTGGANDGMLFDNLVLTSALGNAFTVRIRIADPEEKEARWLARTLMALDLGILRVGSSKASGRLSVRNIRTSGLFGEAFTRFAFGKECGHE